MAVAFRGAPMADTAEDAGRIFDALNWAKGEWPDMALATTGAKGAEKLAIKWAQQKGVKLILARADFDAHGKAAPFRANDDLIALDQRGGDERHVRRHSFRAGDRLDEFELPSLPLHRCG